MSDVSTAEKRKIIAEGKRFKRVVSRGRAPVDQSTSTPARRAGSGSQTSRDVQEIENEPIPEEIGPLSMTKPARKRGVRREVVNYKKNLAQVRQFRKVDPRTYPRESTDMRFWNFFHQDFYETVILPRKQPVLVMQWVDWKYMEKARDPVLKEVVAACEHLNVKRIMGFEYSWCNEIICQFYVTLFVAKDPARTMHWMTCGKWYSVTYDDFSRILGFTREDAMNTDRIHSEKLRSADTMHYMYNDEARFEVGTTIGLLPFYDYLNKLLRKSLAPKGSDASRILSYSLNLLHRMRENTRRFDVFNFIWEEIRLSSNAPQKGCVYAPYIMCMIENITGQTFYKEQKHTSYQVRVIQTPYKKGSGSTKYRTATPASPSSISTPKSIKRTLAAIFCLCQKNSEAIDKMARKQKQLFNHLGLQVTPSDSSGSSGEDQDEDEDMEEQDEEEEESNKESEESEESEEESEDGDE